MCERQRLTPGFFFVCVPRKAKKNTKMTGVRLIPSSRIAPHFSVHSASFSPVTSMKGRTNFLEAQCYGAMRMYSRMFTTTSPHFSSLPAGGMSNTSSTSLFPWDNSLRLQGVVTAFKHRRGYGFVLAEGYTKASAELLKQQREAMSQEGGDSEALETNRQAKKSGASPHVGMPKPKSNDFFFTRVALGGGFFVREGDRVSFRVKPLSEKDGESKRLRHSYVSRGESLSITGERADSEDADGREGCFRKGGHSFTAIGLRHYNPETGKESRILPVAICGVVTQWDPSTGIGIISELDVDGKLHVEDAPKFEVRLENIDISPVPDSSDSFLQEGRYVKFCTSIPSSSNEASPTASSRRSSSTGEDLQRSPSTSSNPLSQAYRVIIDIGTERRNGVVTTRPSERAGASHTRQRPSSSSFGLLADQRGVIREIVERKYAFVVDDASGESIFFHFSEMLEPLSAQNFPRIGDSVVYDTELIPTGRHAGKRHCVRARILREESVIPALGVDLHSQVGEPTIPPSTSSTAISTSEKKNKKNSKTTSGTPKSLLEEFDLLD